MVGPTLLSSASRTTTRLRYPKLAISHSSTLLHNPYPDRHPSYERIHTAYGWMCFIPVRTSCVEFCCLEQVGQNDQRPTSWRVYGTDRKATSSSAWEELGRAGFQDYIDVYTQTAYDCYRVVVNSISSGENLVTTGLQMLMLPPVQNVSRNIRLLDRTWSHTLTIQTRTRYADVDHSGRYTGFHR
jgi:hypothetical protein